MKDLKLVGQFPTAILPECRSALCLFAGEGGHEVRHLDRVKFITALDNNEEKLNELKRKFPFIKIKKLDIFPALINIQGWGIKPIKYDLVISDQYTSDDLKLWKYYNKLKSLANKYLLISVCQQSIDEGLKLPPGELIKRSTWLGGVYWHLTKI